MKSDLANESVIKSMLHGMKSKDETEPFYVVDIGDIVQKWQEWKQALPRVDPFYAAKCNSDSVVLHVLAALGVNFDCSTEGEIASVLNLGVSPSRIIYANTCKGLSHLKYAKDNGVDVMTFDNEEELLKIKQHFPDARLVLRIKVDDSGSRVKLSLKFGADIEEVPRLFRVAKDFGLNVVGLSFHVGCRSHDTFTFAKAIRNARKVFDVAELYGYKMKLLDIGGGFPGMRDNSFVEFAAATNEALNEHFPVSRGVRIIAEPGRYFVCSAFTLLANIIGMREVAPKGKNGKSIMYFINEGVYGAFNNQVYHDLIYEPTPIIDYPAGKLELCTIWGPTCDSVDQVSKKRLLPRMKVGDWLAFENMGAYTVSCSSNFNGFEITKTKYVIHSQLLSFFHQLPSWPELHETLYASKPIEI